MSWNSIKLTEITSYLKRGISPRYVEVDGVCVVNQKCIRANVVDFQFSKRTSSDQSIPVEKIVQEGDVLVNSTGTGTLGRTAYVKDLVELTTVDTHVTIVRPNLEIVFPRFLSYQLSLNERYIESMGKGATNQKELSAADLGQLDITLPPIDIQQRIASILSTYDDLIENNLKRIKLLEEAAQNIYREWFVHFRFPGYETATWYVDDKGRRLPEGWKYMYLAEVCDLTMGQSPSSEYYNDNGDGLPFHQGVTDFGDRFVTNTTYCSIPTRIAQVGDILCSVRAPVGRLNITLDQIIIGRGLSAMRNKNGNQSFQYYQLKSHFHTEDMIGGGSIFNSVTKKVLGEQELLLPTEGIVVGFENVAVPIDNQIQRLHSQNILLMEARDILLPRLMNQTIEV